MKVSKKAQIDFSKNADSNIINIVGRSYRTKDIIDDDK